MSPLLFNLFINNLVQQLNCSGLGINLDTVNIAAVVFADDIVLIGKSDEALTKLMEITRSFFKAHRLELSEKKSKVMSYNSTTGHTTFTGPTLAPISLEEVLCFKYLGIPVCCTPYNLFKNYNDQVKKRSQSYLTNILSMTKTGPNRADLAYTLWTQCALPSILYGCEVMPLTQTTIAEVEKCQTQVGKFILQLPRSSASVSSSLDAGLKPVWALLAERVLLYASSTMKKASTHWARRTMSVNMALGIKSPYTRHLLRWKSATSSTLLSPKHIKKSVNCYAIKSVLDQQKLVSKTTFAMNPPSLTQGSQSKWFSPKSWVSDTCHSKIIARFRACNANLGNRAPTKDGQFFSLCPLCEEFGYRALNSEVTTLYNKFNINLTLPLQVHMIISCPEMAQYRNTCGVGPFIQAYKYTRAYTSPLKLYALNMNDSNPADMNSKAMDLYHMYLGWHSLMNITL